MTSGGQSAIRGTASDNVQYTQTSPAPVPQPPSVQPGSKLDQNPYTAAFKGEVSVADAQSGRVASVQNVNVSGRTAALLAARDASNPQSIRDDNSYLVRGKEIKDNTYKLLSVNQEVRKQNGQSTSGNNRSSLTGSPSSNNIQNEKETGFERRVRESQEREERFFNSEGFKRIDKTANILTGGKPYESRGLAGKFTQGATKGLLAGGIGLAIVPIVAGEKIAATGEGLFRNPRDTSRELFFAFKKTPGQFNPTKPEGLVNLGNVAIGALALRPSLAKPGNVNVASKSYSKSITTQEGKSVTSTVVAGEALVEQRVFGIGSTKLTVKPDSIVSRALKVGEDGKVGTIKLLPDKKLTFTGKATQSGVETGLVGGVSKEPILSLKGDSSFTVQNPGTTFTVKKGSIAGSLFDDGIVASTRKTLFEIKSDSKGGVVAGVGQRKSNVIVNSIIDDGVDFTVKSGSIVGKILGKVGEEKIVVGSTKNPTSKVISTKSVVESFIGKEQGDNFFGGVVRKEGVEVFGAKKILETRGENTASSLRASFRDDLLDIDYAGSNFNGKSLSVREVQTKQSFTESLFEGASAGQKTIPGSAKLTRSGVIDLLKREKSGASKVGAIELFKKTRADSNNNQLRLSTKSNLVQQGLNYNNLVKAGVETQLTPKASKVPFIPIKASNGGTVVKSENQSNSASVYPSNLAKGFVDVRYGNVRPVFVFGDKRSNKNSVVPDSLVTNTGKVGTFSTFRSSSASKIKNDVVSKSQSAQSLIPDIIVGTKPLTESTPKNLSGSKSDSVLKQLQRTSQQSRTRQNETLFSNVPLLTPNFPFPKIPDFKDDINRKFNVEVRRKGKFFTFGRNLNLKDAVKLGENITGGTSARTFRLVQGGNPVKLNNQFSISPKFYTKGNNIIERSKFAINTGGELQEITLVGLRSKKDRRIGVL